jgi:hypothetical protein
VRKQMSHGLSLDANVTWSKSLDDFAPIGSAANSDTNPFNQRFDHGPSPDDVAHVINVSPIYQFPTLGQAGWWSRIANGWSVTSIISWQGGAPFTIYSGADNSFSGVGADRADFSGSNIGQAELSQHRSHSQVVNEFFDTSLFTPNAIGTFGDTGKNVLRGPRYFDTDIAVIKDIPIVERFKAQFRFETFNLFNNVNFMTPGNTVENTGFGQITAAQDPRILQFALKILF